MSQTPNYSQRTVAGPIHFVGRGLHSGRPVRMTLLPAEADSGYVFHRRDLMPPRNRVQARWQTVSDTRLSTTVSNSSGVSVQTIEHLMAALFACGIDNCDIDIDGPEVPIMDGSARPFVEQIMHAGSVSLDKPRMAIVVTETVRVAGRHAEAALIPFPAPWIDFTIDFDASVIGRQGIAVPLTEGHFAEHICGARTFGFAEQIETLQALGLAQGGSLRNAILVRGDVVENPEGLRYPNEFVRHKVVDAIGDLALLGVAIVGCFVGRCSGHQLNNRLLRELMNQPQNWRYTTMAEATEQWEDIIASPEQYAQPALQFAGQGE